MTPTLSTGSLLAARYRVGEVIGRGAMSEVHRAVDERLDRPVALKVLRRESADPERFAMEAELLSALDHPHLVRLLDAGAQDGVPYLVLNLLEESLADRLRLGPVPPPAAARIGGDIGAALGHLHDHGIVHRDVKPSNVFLRADGSACLGDLGAARSADGPHLTATGLTIGTPRYLAPEQVSGDAITGATDVYALGLVLLEAATGEPPFPGTRQESLAARLARPPALPTTLPPEYRMAVGSMVAVDPADRPSARAVVAAMAVLSRSLDAARPASVDAGEATTVMAPTAAAAARGGDTEVLDPGAVAALAVVGPADSGPVDRATAWIADHRQRAAWWAMGGVLVIGVLAGLASADGDGLRPGVGPVATVTSTTTVSSTTTVPVTVAAAPVPPPERGGCDDDCGNGREGKGEKDDKRGKGEDDDD